MKYYNLPQKLCGLSFKEAIQRDPTLRKYEIGLNRIDLGNTEALLLYNRLVLKDLLSLDFTVPHGFLIPTVCSRWNFVSWIIRDQPSRVLEVGTGASAIIAMMLAKIGCEVEATEIIETAYQSARKNIKINNFNSKIRVKKAKNHIIEDLYDSLDKFDAIVCNPPQYDQDYYEKSVSSKKGFVGRELELVGGTVGHEFIIRLLEEVASYENHPSVYFQLTVLNLHEKINSYLVSNGYSFIEDYITVGTRRRNYFRVDY